MRMIRIFTLLLMTAAGTTWAGGGNGYQNPIEGKGRGGASFGGGEGGAIG